MTAQALTDISLLSGEVANRGGAVATATLTVARGWSGIDGRDWEIIVDGQPAGSIGPRQTVELHVEPGQHTLRLRSARRLLSPERPFDATGGQVITFNCHAARWWPRMLVSLAKKDLWITLRQRGND